MKKTILVSFICGLTASLQAQFYGQKEYNTSGTSQNIVVTSASTSNIHLQGFLTGQYDYNTSPSQHFFVRETDALGGFGGTGPFWNGYTVYKDLNCNVSTTQPDQCYGVSVIETGNNLTPSSGSNYALAATCSGPNSGAFCIFATLDMAGAIVSKAFYDLPSGALPWPPYITESVASPTRYYICGSYKLNGQSVGYVLFVDNMGGIVWSKTYAIGSLTTILTGILESPYNSSELIVVGLCVPDPAQPPFLSLALEGFFMKLSTGNGNVNMCNVYGEDNNAYQACNEFHSIAIASSTYGGSSGYVIGGFSDPTPNNPSNSWSWMLKLDPSGNVIWNTLLSNNGTFEVDAVLERQIPGSSPPGFEYFGSAKGPNPTVYKLDNTGTLFSATNNKFEYSYTGAGTAYPVLLTNVNLGGSNDGIQMHTTDNSNTQNDYFVKGYFDGSSGCNENLTQDIQGAGPADVYSVPVNVTTGLNKYNCAGFSITPASFGNGINGLCSATSITSASNAREITGIKENGKTENAVSLQPNPVAQKTMLSLQSQVTDHVQVEVYNNLGQFIKKVYDSGDGNGASQNIEIDFSTLHVEAGLYFLHTTIGSAASVQKVIYTK